jgi:hypothetical protein
MNLYCGPSSIDAHFGQVETLNNQIFFCYIYIHSFIGQSVSSFLTELEQIAFRLKSLNMPIDDN